MSLDATTVPGDVPGWAVLRRSAFRIDQGIGTACEAIGALLVLAEVCILFAGVVSRYVLDSPLFWTDELANFLFLWLSMLGMVVALRRDGHMRLTTVANWVPAGIARWFAAVASLVVIAFVLEVLWPAAQYLDQQRYVELITLQISDGYRVTAILVGMALAAIIALLRLMETTTWRSFCLAVLTVGGIAALLWVARPVLMLMGFGSLIVFFVVIVAACVAIGVPIAIWIRHRDDVVSWPDQRAAAFRGGEPHGRGHVEPAAALGADVRVPWPADGDGGHRARDGGVPRRACGACARRSVVRAAGRDVPGVGHLRFQSGRHGGGGAGAVPRDAAPRLASWRTGGIAGEFQRDVGDHPAEPGADHHRFGGQRVDHRAVHRRVAARGGGGGRAGGGELVPIPPHGYQWGRARVVPNRSCGRSSSPCRG